MCRLLSLSNTYRFFTVVPEHQCSKILWGKKLSTSSKQLLNGCNQFGDTQIEGGKKRASYSGGVKKMGVRFTGLLHICFKLFPWQTKKKHMEGVFRGHQFDATNDPKKYGSLFRSVCGKKNTGMNTTLEKNKLQQSTIVYPLWLMRGFYN